MWRYLSYSPPENRRPLRLQKYSFHGVRTERRKPGRAGRARSTLLSSHHCSVTLIVTVKLLGPNKLVWPLTQADIYDRVSVRQIHQSLILIHQGSLRKGGNPSGIAGTTHELLGPIRNSSCCAGTAGTTQEWLWPLRNSRDHSRTAGTPKEQHQQRSSEMYCRVGNSLLGFSSE